MIITLYRVCANLKTDKTGPKTVFKQEWNMLRNNGMENPNPRSQVIEDLTSFIKSKQKDGYKILLAGDVNRSMRKLSKQKGFGKLMEACQLRDLHGHLESTATHTSGSQPIDCIVGSTLISDHVIRAGYTAFYEVLSSDHRGLFIDIDAAGFYGAKNPDSTRPAARLLKSNDKRAVAKYTKHLKGHLDNCKDILEDIGENAQSPEEAKARYTIPLMTRLATS